MSFTSLFGYRSELWVFLLLISARSLIICNATIISVAGNSETQFPKNFLWGVGSSSYQIEGASNEDDKGESIWDYMTHNHPEKIADGSNADITADSYHQWKQDVQMIRDLNVKIYRFSISWVRILPQGHTNFVNLKGIDYYNNLIDELLKYNITPMVTMYHWDLPQRFQRLGGWTNPEMIPIFKDYARILLEFFGEKVKLWTTFNEPWHICEHGYGVDFMAPAMNYPGVPTYLCGHNLLKAHAEVVHMYRKEYEPKQKGRIGITLDISWPEPKTNSKEDKETAEISRQFYLGWFGHPIFSTEGNYPEVMIKRVEELSREQGFTKSRLPKFTKSEIEFIRGTSDFFGINSYTTNLVTKNHNNSAKYPIPSFNHDMDAVETQNPKWTESASVWLKVYPHGMYKLLMWIDKEYNHPEIIVTENGVSDFGGLDDYPRVDYFNMYLSAVLDAMNDGVNVIGYIAWSLMDSFEWRAGFTEKFGLYHVDFEDPNRKRTPKVSARVYSRICETGMINLNYYPDPEDTAYDLSAYTKSAQSTANQIISFSAISLITFWFVIQIA